MQAIRQVNIKNSQNYFFNDMINIKNFDPSLLNHLKIMILLFMRLNTSKIWIAQILFILFLII